ncbi:MAG TPA: hypothetical protein VNT99_01355 [Methylomirabilota bacterium]|nr:hypothetical protein [Methylomirabilota bacterium]
MKFLDATLPTPAENLACDEALLDLCQKERVEILRLWESRQHFVVAGYGNRVEHEVNVDECSRRGVPILRRCSGGGTVVQGPGCLNYNVTLRIPEGGPLATVTGTNEFVMERNRAAFEELLGLKVSVQGHTDLAFASLAPTTVPTSGEYKSRKYDDETHWLKFSGNAQRRRRRALVFHGTCLYNFDLNLIEALLRFPSAPPEYRAHRSHTRFVRNIPALAHSIRAALQRAWNANEPFTHPPHHQITQLVQDQYANADWNLRR